MSGNALVATGIGLSVNDLGAWPEAFHSEVKVLCPKAPDRREAHDRSSTWSSSLPHPREAVQGDEIQGFVQQGQSNVIIIENYPPGGGVWL